jgi:hypothetical protein
MIYSARRPWKAFKKECEYPQKLQNRNTDRIDSKGSARNMAKNMQIPFRNKHCGRFAPASHQRTPPKARPETWQNCIQVVQVSHSDGAERDR